MNKYLALTKVLLKNGTESSSNRKKRLALIAVLVLAFTPTIAMFCGGIAKLYDALKMINQQGFILGLITSAVSAIVFFFGIFYVINVFYFSKDTEYLLPLPLKPIEILGAKFTSVLVYEYIIELLILLPFLVTYGYKDGAGIVYYVYCVLVYLALPIVPLALASFIDMIIMRFSNITKNKDKFRIIAGIAGMTVAIGLNVVIQNVAKSSASPEQMQKLFMEGNNSSIQFTSKLFPSARIGTMGLVNSNNIKGVEYIALFLIITAAFIALFLALGEMLYFKGVVGSSEAASKRKIISGAELEKSTVQSSSLKAYTVKEIRLLFRTPAYFMNCVLINFLLPVFLLIPVFTQPEAMKAFKNADKMLNKQMSGIVLAAAFAFIMFISVTNSVASTAISREGQNLYISKYLPISYSKQIMAKILSAVFMSLIGVGILLVLAVIVVKPPVDLFIGVIVTGMLAILFGSFTGLFIDLNFPKLNWDNEQKAVKQNFNVMINMLLCAALAGASVLLVIKMKMGFYGAFALIGITFGILDIVMYYILNTKGVQLYRKLEP